MLLKITKNENIARDIWQLDLTGEFPYEQANSGQFIDIRIGETYDYLLRRPISIAAVDVAKSCLTIVFRVVGSGTKWLSERKPGDHLDILGPLGTGFPLPTGSKKVLIVGGGIGVPPLYQLARDVKEQGGLIDLVLGFRTKSEVFWQAEFAELGLLKITTEDGSLGDQGYVTDVISHEKQSWDYVYSCGPIPMLKALKQHFHGQNVHGFISLEERMACGIGACYGCVCSSAHQEQAKRVCKDGPVFNWTEVEL